MDDNITQTSSPTSPPWVERWFPEKKFARIPLQLGTLIPISLLLLTTVTITALATRSLFPLVLIAFTILLWVMTRGSSSRHQLLTNNVAFELTSTVARVRIASATRELSLSEVESVTVLRTSRRADVGHVLIHQTKASDTHPAIPTGRRVSGGNLGLVVWSTVEHVDPAEQLFDGVMTFWFVARPQEVRSRILAAVSGLSPYSQGPHR